jgi:hypothetical protein
MNNAPANGSWPLHNTAAQLHSFYPDLEKAHMSESDSNTPRWSPTSASTVAQDPDLTAPRFNAHATPFSQPQHQTHDIPYTIFSGFSPTQYSTAPSASSGNQPRAPIPYSYDERYHTLPTYYPHYSGVYHYQTAQPTQPAHLPRRPAFAPHRPVGMRPDMAGLHGIANMSPQPVRPMVQGVPGLAPPHPGGYEPASTPIHPASPYRPQHHARSLQPPARYSGGSDHVPASFGSGADQSRHLPPAYGRPLQQQGERFYDRADRRASRISHTQGRRPDGNVSPPTSTRRNYDRFSRDLSQSLTSSDAEEAASRIPPSFRARHLPREPGLRFSSHQQHYDPNVTTPRQILDLKAKLPRLVLSELPEGAASTCDICDKEFSSGHVPPSEDAEVAIGLPCGHRFGEWCMFQWVRIVLPEFLGYEHFAHLNLVRDV